MYIEYAFNKYRKLVPLLDILAAGVQMPCFLESLYVIFDIRNDIVEIVYYKIKSLESLRVSMIFKQTTSTRSSILKFFYPTAELNYMKP